MSEAVLYDAIEECPFFSLRLEEGGDVWRTWPNIS